jgi:hypothetical protein
MLAKDQVKELVGRLAYHAGQFNACNRVAGGAEAAGGGRRFCSRPRYVRTERGIWC